MPDERIEVEWIGTATKMTQILDRIDTRLTKQERALMKVGTASKKSAQTAAQEFSKLEKELRDNEAALKRMERGSAAYQRQQQKVEKLKISLRNARNELRSLQPKDSAWPQIVTGMNSAVSMAMRLFGALKSVARAQKEVAQGGSDVAVEMDTLARQLQVQAGLTDPQRKAITKEILDIASAPDIGVRAEIGFRAATQLTSSGFQDAVESGALRTVLAAMQASNFQGTPEEFVKGLSQALQASGLEKNQANLERLAVAAQSLFKTTDFQVAELSDFAKQASVFQGANLTQEQALAGFTALREVLPARESATGLRNFISILQQGDVTKETAANLERLGVKAEDVDFVGESLVEVLRNVKQGVDALPEAERNQALIKAFGRENSASARLLLENIDRIVELEDKQTDKEQFRKDQLAAAQSLQARRNRQENERLLDVLPRGEKLAAIQEENRRIEDKARAKREELLTEQGRGRAFAAEPIVDFQETVDTALGEGQTERSLDAFRAFGQTFERHLEESRRVQEAGNALLTQILNQRENQPVQAKVPVRPKEADLPAATVP